MAIIFVDEHVRVREELATQNKLDESLKIISGQSSDHLLSLINDVLDMSRIESGKMDMNERPVNMTSTARRFSS